MRLFVRWVRYNESSSLYVRNRIFLYRKGVRLVEKIFQRSYYYIPRTLPYCTCIRYYKKTKHSRIWIIENIFKMCQRRKVP